MCSFWEHQVLFWSLTKVPTVERMAFDAQEEFGIVRALCDTCWHGTTAGLNRQVICMQTFKKETGTAFQSEKQAHS